MIALVAFCFTLPALAFPPAPHHLIHGLVRDEWGNPLNTLSAEVILESAAGSQTRATIRPNPALGENYELHVPMDSGIREDLYKPTALRPQMAFKIKVRIGQIIYLPIQMTGDYKLLGQPGQSTRIDLTLGEDIDNDGLPDAWERALIAQMGGGLTLLDIHPGMDSDGDGMSNLDEYTAGTYAFDPENGFALKIVAVRGAAAVLQFTAIRGRDYSIQASEDFENWTQVPFRLSMDTAPDFARTVYSALDVHQVEVEVPQSVNGAAPQFFKLVVE